VRSQDSYAQQQCCEISRQLRSTTVLWDLKTVTLNNSAVRYQDSYAQQQCCEISRQLHSWQTFSRLFFFLTQNFLSASTAARQWAPYRARWVLSAISNLISSRFFQYYIPTQPVSLPSKVLYSIQNCQLNFLANFPFYLYALHPTFFIQSCH